MASTKFKLGKKAPKRNAQTICMSRYFAATDDLPAPAAKVAWEYKVDPATIGMYGNDELSDCLAAYWAHHLMLITAHTGTAFVPDPADVVKLYSGFTGYVPGDPSTDNGGTFSDLYAYLKSTGFCGRKITAFGAVDIHNPDHMALAMQIFIGMGVGVQLPSSAQGQFSAGQDWTVVPNSPIEGGHALLQSGRGSAGKNYASWGKGDVKAPDPWTDTYCDEAWVPLTPEIISVANDLSPTGLDWDALVADVPALG
jgi:hypothetical protein